MVGLLAFNAYSQNDLSSVNSKHDELQPVFHPNGKALYFTRAYDSLNSGGKRDKGDIWISELRDDGSWSKPQNAGETLNNRFFNAVVGFSPDGNIIFLHGHYPHNNKPPRSQGLSYAVKRGNGWTFPKEMEVQYFNNKSDHQSGSISADGNILLLAIESYSTYGAEDLYVSFFDGEKFSQPKNLGGTINTNLQEMTPTLATDNRTLFFSSNGHPGKGGRDIYKSIRLDSTWTNWSAPENLGEKVNSEGVELSFIIEPKMEWGIYTSTQNSDGYGDMKYYKMPEDSVFEDVADTAGALSGKDFEALNKADKVFSGGIFDEKTRNSIGASVLIRSGNGRFEDSLYVGARERSFKFAIPDTLTRVFVEVKSKGYMPVTETVVVENGVLERNYFLAPLEVGTTIKLDKIYFERGTANLIDSSYAELNKVAEVMLENKTMSIRLTGHTDNQGDAQKNLELSQQRVDMVKQYLVNKGIDSNRISGQGYGGSRPIASNANEETRKLNRRVEFIITEF